MLEASVDDAVMSWQLYRAHAMLFVCAYLGLLGYFAVTDPHDPVAALFKPPAQEQPKSVVAMPGPSATRNVSVADVAKPVEQNVSKAVEPSSDVVTEATARQQERIRLSQVGLQATSAEAPQERAQAIDQLNAATPEALQALQAVVTSDSAVRNRIRALNSLRALAEREDTKDAVISIVHLATTDTNASVASRAGELYRELTREPAGEQ